MISLIVSSYKQDYFERFSASVKETIGVPYEIIKIHNPGLYSTTQAYNMGAEKAQFDLLCFVHEDIIFHTGNWGKTLLDYFNTIPDLGLLGIAGAEHKVALPTGWSHPDETKNRWHLIQQDKTGEKISLSTFSGKDIEYLKVLDGVFLVTQKQVWREIKFDETIPGYHVYDIDFSLRVHRKYKVAMTYKILIEHFSPGSFADDWVNATLTYHARQDKASLFDAPDKKIFLKRDAYYLHLLNYHISFKTKIRFIKRFGINSFESFLLATRFLFPVAGRYLQSACHKMLRLLKLKKPLSA